MLIDHIECRSFKANCNRVTLRGLIPKYRETIEPTQYWARIVLRNRSSPPTTDCDKIRPLQTLEALLILLSAKPNIFLLSGACLLSFVCCTVVLTEVYPVFTRHFGLFRFKQFALDFNDNFCCVPCSPVATWKVAICLLIVSDEGNQREEMARCM